MSSTAELLTRYEFFSELSDEHRQQVAGCGTLVRLARGTHLFVAGEPANEFFLLQDGVIALELATPAVAGFRFETLGTGDVVGWSWLFAPHRWSFDGYVVEDANVVRFDGDCVRAKCDQDHELGYALMKRFAQVVVKRLASSRLQLMDIYGQRAG